MTIQKETYYQDEALEKKLCFSRAVKVGDTVYLAGIGSQSDSDGMKILGDDMEAQTRQLWKNAKKMLAMYDATLENVVEMTICWAVDIINDQKSMQGYLRATREAWDGIPDFPAPIGMQVVNLAIPEMLIEIKMTARLPQ